MAVVYVNNGGIFAEGDYSVTVDFPAIVADKVIAVAMLGDADNDTFTVPSGWALIDEDGTNSNWSICAMWKRCDGTEGGTSQTFTSQLNAGAGVYGVIAIFSGVVESGDPYEDKEISNVAQSTVIQSMATFSTLDPTTDGCLITSFVFIEDNVTPDLLGTSFGQLYDQIEFTLLSDFGGDVSLGVHTYEQDPAAQLSKSQSAIGSNEYNGVITIALTPATTGVYTISCSVGEFALSGKDIDLRQNYKMSTSVGNFSLVGNNIFLNKVYTMIVSVGVFSLTGNNISLRTIYKMSASVGVFVLTGIDIGLSKVYSMMISAGNFVLDGKDILLRQNYKVSVSVGTFLLSGKNVGLTQVYKMVATVGNFVLSGKDIGVYFHRKISAAVGMFSLSGKDIILTYTGGGPPAWAHKFLNKNNSGKINTVLIANIKKVIGVE